MEGDIRILLLAAGASRRFGSNKLLEPMPDGTPMLVRSAKALLATGAPVLAVLRRGDKAAAELLAPLAGLAATECGNADAGMGHSLAWGVRRSRNANGWLVALADMPFLSPDTIRKVRLVLDAGASIAAPAYRGRRGHPVGFSRRWRDDVLALTGDLGAQLLLRAHSETLTLVPCDDSGALRDIDVRADLLQGGSSSVTALTGSVEEERFQADAMRFPGSPDEVGSLDFKTADLYARHEQSSPGTRRVPLATHQGRVPTPAGAASSTHRRSSNYVQRHSDFQG